MVDTKTTTSPTATPLDAWITSSGDNCGPKSRRLSASPKNKGETSTILVTSPPPTITRPPSSSAARQHNSSSSIRFPDHRRRAPSFTHLRHNSVIAPPLHRSFSCPPLFGLSRRRHRTLLTHSNRYLPDSSWSTFVAWLRNPPRYSDSRLRSSQCFSDPDSLMMINNPTTCTDGNVVGLVQTVVDLVVNRDRHFGSSTPASKARTASFGSSIPSSSSSSSILASSPASFASSSCVTAPGSSLSSHIKQALRTSCPIYIEVWATCVCARSTYHCSREDPIIELPTPTKCISSEVARANDESLSPPASPIGHHSSVLLERWSVSICPSSSTTRHHPPECSILGPGPTLLRALSSMLASHHALHHGNRSEASRGCGTKIAKTERYVQDFTYVYKILPPDDLVESDVRHQSVPTCQSDHPGTHPSTSTSNSGCTTTRPQVFSLPFVPLSKQRVLKVELVRYVISPQICATSIPLSSSITDVTSSVTAPWQIVEETTSLKDDDDDDVEDGPIVDDQPVKRDDRPPTLTEEISRLVKCFNTECEIGIDNKARLLSPQWHNDSADEVVSGSGIAPSSPPIATKRGVSSRSSVKDETLPGPTTIEGVVSSPLSPQDASLPYDDAGSEADDEEDLAGLNSGKRKSGPGTHRVIHHHRSSAVVTTSTSSTGVTCRRTLDFRQSTASPPLPVSGSCSTGSVATTRPDVRPITKVQLHTYLSTFASPSTADVNNSSQVDETDETDVTSPTASPATPFTPFSERLLSSAHNVRRHSTSTRNMRTRRAGHIPGPGRGYGPSHKLEKPSFSGHFSGPGPLTIRRYGFASCHNIRRANSSCDEDGKPPINLPKPPEPVKPRVESKPNDTPVSSEQSFVGLLRRSTQTLFNRRTPFVPIASKKTSPMSVPSFQSEASVAWSPSDTRQPTESGSLSRLVGSFEECLLKGCLLPIGTVEGFRAELGASGAFCPDHTTLPVVTYYFKFPHDATPSPYLGHVSLRGCSGPSKRYAVPPQGSIQLTLFNPTGSVMKMFVVLYDLSWLPPGAKTFIRQRTLYVPVGSFDPSCNGDNGSSNLVVPSEMTSSTTSSISSSKDAPSGLPSYLRYVIHLRFMSSRSGRIYLHSDIRLVFAPHDRFCFESHLATYELRSFTDAPKEPRFSPKY